MPSVEEIGCSEFGLGKTVQVMGGPGVLVGQKGGYIMATETSPQYPPPARGTYPGMSTGSATVDYAPAGTYGQFSPLPRLGRDAGMRMTPGTGAMRVGLPSLGPQAGMSMGPIRGPLPRLNISMGPIGAPLPRTNISMGPIGRQRPEPEPASVPARPQAAFIQQALKAYGGSALRGLSEQDEVATKSTTIRLGPVTVLALAALAGWLLLKR